MLSQRVTLRVFAYERAVVGVVGIRSPGLEDNDSQEDLVVNLSELLAKWSALRAHVTHPCIEQSLNHLGLHSARGLSG